MIQICVLKAPEFGGVVAAAEQSGMSKEVRGDYFLLSSEAREVTISAQEADIPEAVWFGALTGGFDGTIVTFNDKEIKLHDELRSEGDDPDDI